jgi:glutaredoxin
MLAVQFVVPAEVSAGEIYKWVDERGRVRFSDTAPKADTQVEAEKVIIRPDINTIKGADVSVSDYLQTVQEKRQEAEKLAAERQKPVVMYSTAWCGVCKRARQYFVANNIPFSEYDIEKSERGRKDYANLNGRGVPIIMVGKKRMNGFSSARFKQMYSH